MDNNISYDRNIRFSIGSSKVYASCKVYFGNEVERTHNKGYKGLIKSNINGDIKFQMMLLGRYGYDKH